MNWRLRLVALFGIAWVATLLSGSVLGARQTPAHEIRGRVVDAVTGRPVDGVAVTLIWRSPGGQATQADRSETDARGAFMLKAPGVGEFRVDAFRMPGSYGMTERGPGEEGPLRWSRVSGPTSGIVIQLWHWPTISGVVRDEAGEAVPRALVRAIRRVFVGDREVLKSDMRAQTDARGEYTVQVTPGRYGIAVTPPAAATPSARPTSYYPGVATPAAATILELGPSQRAEGVDVVVRREAGFVIAGSVAIPSELTRTANLYLMSGPDAGILTDIPVAIAAVSRDGSFRFPPVAAGSYEIRFVRYSERPATGTEGAVRTVGQRLGIERLALPPAGETWWLAQEVEVRDRDVRVPLTLNPGVRVSGRIEFRGRAESEPSGDVMRSRGVYLRALDQRFSDPIPLGPAAGDRTFVTAAVPPGKYVLGMFDGFEGYQLESVRVAGREVGGEAFDLDRNVAGALLTFAARRTRIRGQVAGEGESGRTILVWPDDERQWSAIGTQLGRVHRAITIDGSYDVAVFPGTYRLAAFSGSLPRDWESPEFLRSARRDSVLALVTPGQTVIQNLTILPRR